VLADGEIVWVGGRTRDLPGYDLTGVVIGSEGTLAIVTKILVRLSACRRQCAPCSPSSTRWTSQ